jgi:hypothetical protein
MLLLVSIRHKKLQLFDFTVEKYYMFCINLEVIPAPVEGALTFWFR